MRRTPPRRQRHIPAQGAQADRARPKQESKLDPAPMYDAPFYRGSGKLQDKVALITGEILPILGGYSGG